MSQAGQRSSSPMLPPAPKRSGSWVFDVLLIGVLLVGGYLRLVGVNWDENQHLHPDERFLTMVEDGIRPVQNLGQYFNTAISTLNPNNNPSFGFFVYGTLPVFIVRYVAEWLGQANYDQYTLVGRQLSALADLLTVALVYWIASRLYSKKVGLLASAFSALAVLPIQLSHFFTVDTFTNFFGFIAVYFAVRIMTGSRAPLGFHSLNEKMAPGSQGGGEEAGAVREASLERQPLVYIRAARGIFVELLPYLAFGAALGMATASKINAVVLAVLLPVALAVRYYRLPLEQRRKQMGGFIRDLAVAAVVSFFVFRIFQPYAFSGPGFFGLSPNPKWVANMTELANESNGNVDFPPALQWARRPPWYSWQNLTEWGLGWPLGLLAWAGFLWMGWRIFKKKEWQTHLLLWGWTAFYFIWQSLSFTATMRYQMLIYPTLEIIAAWAVFELWRVRPVARKIKVLTSPRTWKIASVVVGTGVLLGTAIWAFAFASIYTRPMTRIASSRWIYQNVPGPFNLIMDTGSGVYHQPLPYQNGAVVTPSAPYEQVFVAQDDGILTQIELPHVAALNSSLADQILDVSIAPSESPAQSLASDTLAGNFPLGSDQRGQDYKIPLASPAPLQAGTSYLLKISVVQGGTPIQLMGPSVLTFLTQNGAVDQSLPEPVFMVYADHTFSTTFAAAQDGTLKSVTLPKVVDETAQAGAKTLQLTVALQNGEDPMQTVLAQVTSTFPMTADGNGQGTTFSFTKALKLVKGELYTLNLSMISGQGMIAVRGSAPAMESSWDDPQPVPLDGYSPYSYTSGLYQGDLNFEMYWDDNADKLTRFINTLDQADYIFITSNRQWATTVRVPERYPLTTAYYRDLIGCPQQDPIIWCYSVAKPGQFGGNLGYSLVATFQSDPQLGPFDFNDQFAEEAFTVYDHPKVLIFKKNANYNSPQVRSLLSAVDLSHVVHLTPREASQFSLASLLGTAKQTTLTLMLPASQWLIQQAGGTWSALYNRAALINRFPGLGAVVWYLTILILGLLAYPYLRIALPGLADRGYPLARITGLLLLAYTTWMAGSFDIPVTRGLISLAVLGIAVVGALLAIYQRKGLLHELRTKKGYFLTVELVALAFFLFDLGIRMGNPDLWHPYKGGEKPMDFSYLNAVLKSTIFPPYDPWFAGGYLNYYYYGFVIVGMPVKLLGIVPSIAYNLILPSLFSMVALGAFSIGWNIFHAARKIPEPPPDSDRPGKGWFAWFDQRFLMGISASVGLVVLGNLGTVRMIYQGLQKLVAPGGVIDNASIPTHLFWAFEGVFKFIGGASLPYAVGDWYWIPSRVYPGTPITEFPFFTFLYADLHAHMIALPVAAFAVAWALSILLGKASWREPDGLLSAGKAQPWVGVIFSFALGALAIGALDPTNTWDYPTYLALSLVMILYTLMRYLPTLNRLPVNRWVQRGVVTIVGIIVLVVLSRLMYHPYYQWYGNAYNSIDLWHDERSPIWSYLTHWGLFLFVITTWLAWETYHWMAITPLSSLKKLYPYRYGILFGLVVLILAILYLELVLQVQIAWVTLILATWAAVLILRPDLPDAKRFVLFLIGTGLMITLTVELVVLQGDIGRMNTVFKLYIQAWVLLSVSAAAAFVWMLEARPAWSINWRHAWEVSTTALIFGAALFTLLGGMDKIRDRMAPQAPHTLDGMTYMDYAQYTMVNTATQQGVTMDLSQDYRAILWMQAHVIGSPVIVEGNTVEYQWGTRFTIYTGLPGVVGWNWHQRQQRAILSPEVVTDRIAEIAQFYTTTDAQAAEAFLKKYNVRYIIVGQLEENDYPGPGLAKFPSLNGKLWNQVYHDQDTTIYQVAP